jgi:hypothetical protein
MNDIIIDGKKYKQVPTEIFPIGNACRRCAFYLTACYNRDDFMCHGDARPDGVDVVFVLKN